MALSRNPTLKPIVTKRTIEEPKMEPKIVEIMTLEKEEEPMSPASRLFHAPHFNCCIIAIIGTKIKLDVNAIKVGIERSLLKHPRFTSIMVAMDKKGEAMQWIQTTVNLDNHIIVPNVNPNMDSADQFIEDYISDLSKSPMDLSIPLWKLHLLNVKTSDANAVGVLQIHHSIGDGASLISLLLACTRKTFNPEALPTIPRKKRAISRGYTGNWCFLFAVLSTLRLILNTMVDLMLFLATALFLKDTKTPLKGPLGVELNPKRFVHLTVSLDDIRLVKNAMKMTINDVLLGMTQAGLSRYLNRRYCDQEKKDDGATNKKNYLPKSIRLRAIIAFNKRPSVGIEALADMMEKKSKVKWGNSLGFVLFPFNIALRNDPLDYIYQAKATIDRKKHSLEAFCTFSATELLLKSYGVEAAADLTCKVFSNTTMTFSNVIGPEEEVSFYGHPVAYIAPSAYGVPHALTVHFHSYAKKMTIVLAVDEGVVPDPHQLCNDIGESLSLIKNAVLQRGLDH